MKKLILITIGLLYSSNVYGQIRATEPGLVSLYHFNESSGTSAYDTKGLQTLPLSGSVSWASSKDANYGSCLTFANTGLARTTAAFGLPDPPCSYSITCWVYNTADNGDNGMVMWGRGGVSNSLIALMCENREMQSPHWDNDWNTGIYITLSSWTFITITYTSGTTTNTGVETLYINGTQKAQKTGIGDLYYLFLPDYFSVGSYSMWEGGYFIGSIDEVSIWNRTLSSSDVSKIFNEQSLVDTVIINVDNEEQIEFE